MKTESSDLFVMKMIYPMSDETSMQETAQKLAVELNISAAKAYEVLNRYPGALIRPMDRERTDEIANSFIKVGVPVEVLPVSAPASSTPMFPPSVSSPAMIEPIGAMPAITPIGTLQEYAAMSSTMPTMPPMHADARQMPATEDMMQPLKMLEQTDDDIEKVRTSLRTKLVASSLVPVLFIGLSALSLLAINVPRGLNELDQSRAQQLASALVVDLQPSETMRNNLHLREAVQTSEGDIAFVDLAIPNDTKQSMFISTDVSTDVQGAQAFNTFKGTPEFQLQKPTWQNPSIVNGSLEVFKAQVFEDSIGKRTMQFANLLGGFKAASATDKKLFDVSFGYSTARAQAIIWQQLGLMSALIGLVLASAAGLALIFSRSISKSIIRLTEAADTISLGELDIPVEQKSNDELGDLAEALERMRLSLRSALERLRRRR
jgi:HAMP domain-containing protein